MPSLNKILKLQAGVRAGAQSRLFTRVKNGNQTFHKEKPTGAPDSSSACRPSFVNSYVSSFSSIASATTFSAGALHLKHGKGTILTASGARSRVVAAPSVREPFGQSCQSLSNGNDPEWTRGCSEKATFMNSRERTQDVLGKIATGGDNSDDRLSPKRLAKESRIAIPSSPRHKVWKERSWRALGAEVKDETLKRMARSRFIRNSIESRPCKIERREDVGRAVGFRDPFENGVGRDMSKGIWKSEKAEAIGRANGRNRSKSTYGEARMTGLQPLRNCLSSVDNNNESRILPRVRGFITRALHDVNLAGEGATLDRALENENNARQSDQSASDGKSLKLHSGACNLPHPDKVKTGGEDAYFMCADKNVVGVADGVGGWSDLGIDAGEYARELMSQAMIAVDQDPLGSIDPVRVMEKAHSVTKCRGSSTACILALTDSSLVAANLGDSGFVIVRNSRPVFKSPVQQHQFNIPFQLENGGSDPPSAAQVFSLGVFVGDIIVAGTDGLFDNLYDSELTTIVVQAIRGGLDPQVTAQKIASLARSRAQDRNRQTPFSTAAQDAGFRFYGGKMDDITVIVSYITSSKSATKRA